MSFIDNPGNGVVGQMAYMQRHGSEWQHSYGRVTDEVTARAIAQIEGAQNISFLLAQAERARLRARSWRKFLVGAAAVAAFTEVNRPPIFRVVLGANNKPVQGSDVINVHAEHEIMLQAVEAKAPTQTVQIPLFTVIGDLQPDQQTGIKTPTLHPCGVCRESFMEEESPIRPESICVTASPDLRHFEWFSVQSLIAYHRGEHDGSEFGRATFQSVPLALATSLPQPGDPSIDMNIFETQEMIESDHEIAERLQAPLLRYVHNQLDRAA